MAGREEGRLVQTQQTGTRSFNYDVAEALAPTWEARREDIEQITAPVRRWLIDALGPGPGETVLELAAGVGDTGFEAARMIGEDGRLISSDFSPAMVDAARRRGAELGLGNVDYRVLDAERIALDADSVDGVLCRYGYMLMDDPAAALSETRRVLRPRGRLALAVWGPPERNPFFAIAGTVLVRQGHLPPPDPSEPGIFFLAGEERLSALLAQAGFRGVRIEHVPVGFAFPDLDAYLALVSDTAGPVAMALRGLSAGEREALTGAVADACRPFFREDGYAFPGLTIVAMASA
jgi:SAM-dependent methyltransferase